MVQSYCFLLYTEELDWVTLASAPETGEFGLAGAGEDELTDSGLSFLPEAKDAISDGVEAVPGFSGTKMGFWPNLWIVIWGILSSLEDRELSARTRLLFGKREGAELELKLSGSFPWSFNHFLATELSKLFNRSSMVVDAKDLFSRRSLTENLVEGVLSWSLSAGNALNSELYTLDKTGVPILGLK